MDRAAEERIAQTYSELTGDFDQWEKTKDLVDQLLDIMMNYRRPAIRAAHARRCMHCW